VFTGRVFNGRRMPLDFSEFPVALVYGKEELSEVFNEAPIVMKNTYFVAVDVLTTQGDSENLDDEVDTLTSKISSILNSNDGLGPDVNQYLLTKTELDFSIQGEQILGFAKMTYECTYFVEPETRESHLPDGKTGSMLVEGVA
jgi:hypothetical protein